MRFMQCRLARAGLQNQGPEQVSRFTGAMGGLCG